MTLAGGFHCDNGRPEKFVGPPATEEEVLELAREVMNLRTALIGVRGFSQELATIVENHVAEYSVARSSTIDPAIKED